MSNKEKSVEMMPKSNGPLVNDTATTNVESMADGIKTDINKRGGSGSNNKKKDKHKNKDETRAHNNNNNNKNTNNNNNSKAKSPKVSTHENGLNALATAATTADDVNDDDDEEKIRAVGEELLKRLQCNGTSISVCKSDKLSPKQTTTHGSAGAQATAATAANDVSSSENPNTQLKSKPLNNNNTNKKNHNNNNNSSRAHDKNCQYQQPHHPKSMKSVNSSNSSSNCTEADDMKIIQCNGTHIEPTETSATPSDRLSGPGTSCSTSQMATAISCDDTAMPSCSSSIQANDNHQPSTSSATEMDGAAALHIVPKSALSVKSIKTDTVEVTFKEYENELQMPDIMRVIQRELSEPYSIYTYRYFIHNWPKLCFLAMDGDNCIGAIVCKLDIHRQMTKRGYIAMLAVDAAYRKFKIGTTLVQKAIEVYCRAIFFDFHKLMVFLKSQFHFI